MIIYMKRFAFFLLILLVLQTGNFTYANAGANTEVAVMNFDALDQQWLNRDDDQVYVVNFWATWCAPCVKELPAFEALQAKYADSGVKVLLVSLDFPGHLESRLKPFLQQMNIQSEVVLLDDPDANRWIPLVDESWQGAIPATVVYTKDHRAFHQREFTFEQLEAIIKPLL